ncbi:MAG TPA: mechanosensitive ion channel family protein [Gemmatimonadales bacterium]
MFATLARAGWTDTLTIDSEALFKLGLRITAIWLLAWGAWVMVRVVARRIELAVDDGDDTTLTAAEKRGQTIAQLLRSVGKVVIIIIGLLMTMSLFIDIAPLLAGAGILGLAVSFGAQSLVKDVIAGFFQLMENQFSVGDVVELAGKEGTVEKMNLRVVHVRDGKGHVHIIPNGQIGVVTNMTKGWSRAVVDVGVEYGADLDRAIGVLRDESQRLFDDPAWHPRFDGAPDVLGVQELGDSSVVVRTLLRVQPGKQWEVAREFRRRVKLRFDKEGIEIPFPQRVVRHIGAPGARGAQDA